MPRYLREEVERCTFYVVSLLLASCFLYTFTSDPKPRFKYAVWGLGWSLFLYRALQPVLRDLLAFLPSQNDEPSNPDTSNGAGGDELV
ncbi:hypothetical protein AMTR_s00026p00139090 [Amborella trichopoda]|uniref:Uncharacterized protein n=1 Tax=Amborella trichopoda TaxID=13333 RepID=W1PSY9_AMBTC|nr:hypothetical protein AMTR_s00026p00139090 [Amborella trichopoda]